MPETYELIAQARSVLAGLYLDEASARRVAMDAGLDLRQIAFSDRPINNWQGILEEAQKQGRVHVVLDVALLGYRTHAELLRVCAAWAVHEQTPAAQPASPSRMNVDPAELAALKRQLASAQENLILIEERKSEYVLEVDVPLQLVREERRLRDRIADLERRIAGS